MTTSEQVCDGEPVYVPVCTEMGLDAGWWPWLAPDHNPMPRLDLFPRLARIGRLLGLGR